MGEAIKILKPLLGEDEENKSTGVVIGTVKKDFHDIGKNIAAMMLESSGMTAHDLGVDSAIIDPLDDKIMATIKTAGMLLGEDDSCMTGGR